LSAKWSTAAPAAPCVEAQTTQQKAKVIVPRNTIWSYAVAIVLIGSFTAAKASADTFDHRVLFTFSAPIELPGVALAPGKYIFREADPLTTKNVVQVLSADGMKSYGIFFTLPIQRLDPAPKPEVQFMEAPAGAPPPIRAYWNGGETTGHEFIYPKEQARRLAKNSKQPVLTTESQTTTTAQTNTSNLVRLSSNGQETKVTAGDKPAPSARSGSAQQGEAAPDSIAIPPVIIVLVPAGTGR
jgi:hypothetical protein